MVRSICVHKHLPVIRRINIHHLLLLQCLLRRMVAVSAPTNALKLLLHAHYFASASAFATLVPAVINTVSILLSRLIWTVRTRAQSASQCHRGFQSACQSCHLRPLSDRAGRIVIQLFVSVPSKTVSGLFFLIPSPASRLSDKVRLPSYP
jgi:hypothetical protein